MQAQLRTMHGDRWIIELTAEGLSVTCTDIPGERWVGRTPGEVEQVLAQLLPPTDLVLAQREAAATSEHGASRYSSSAIHGFMLAGGIIINLPERAWLSGALLAALISWRSVNLPMG